MSEFFANAVRDLHRAQQDIRDQRALSVGHTQQVILQTTVGFGHTIVTVTFDIPFTSEPTFAYGAALSSISHRGVIPAGSGVILRWVRDAKGHYTGVQLSLDVIARLSPSFSTSARLPLVTTIDGLTATMVHYLTFDGNAGPHANTSDIVSKMTNVQPVETDT